MVIEQIEKDIFDAFSKNHILKSFYQTSAYGELMSKNGYTSIYIGGYVDSKIVAASLILCKSIGPNIKYGYAPRGFLINYYDTSLLKEFTKKIKDYFFMKGFAFIKINPEITYNVVEYDTKAKIVNSKNKEIIDILKELGYDKLKDNLYFESMLPKYNPIIYLPKYDFTLLDENIKNEINSYEARGIKLIKGNDKDIECAYNFIEKKTINKIDYYKDLYKIFNEKNMIDLLLVKLDYPIYVKYIQKKYSNEMSINENINEEFNNNPSNNELYNKKMQSDKTLNEISRTIAIINNRMQEDTTSEILGAAFVIKYENRINILISGQKNDFNNIDVKTFIFYKIIEKYKKENFLFLDMNGITGDMTENNPYKDVNEFKLKFNPTTFEYIGEFDLIVNKPFHQLLWSTGKIQKEFFKPKRKTQ